MIEPEAPEALEETAEHLIEDDPSRRLAPPLTMAVAVYTVPEAARILRCHPDKVYGLVRTGAMRGTRLGKASIRIAREELERFIRDGCS